MALFKSSEERRIERDIKIRQGIRRIEKSIREQGKFQDEFIRNAQRAKKIGDMQQYAFIRNSLKKTATIRKMLERQLLAVKNALLIKRQAEAEGLDKIFIEAGFEWREPGCSMCLAMNADRLAAGEHCAATSNRNFEGRQGQGGRTHLASPAMVAAAAIAGHFVDVREFSIA